MQPDAELVAVAAQRLDLSARNRIHDRLVDVDGRHIVVFGRDRQVRAAHGTTGEPQPVEGLRAGHLVNQMQVDVDEVGLTCPALSGSGNDDVVVPHLFGHGAGLVREGHLDYLTIWDDSISL